MVTPLEINLFDEVEMKREHPCSKRSKRFQVIRLGSDLKIKCLGCGNVIMIDRDKFNSRVKRVVASHEKEIAL